MEVHGLFHAPSFILFGELQFFVSIGKYYAIFSGSNTGKVDFLKISFARTKWAVIQKQSADLFRDKILFYNLIDRWT